VRGYLGATFVPESAGRDVPQEWAMDYNRIVIHFDVDVIDFVDLPLSEASHFRNSGPTYNQPLAVLKVLLVDDRIAALSIGELNPDHGEEGGTTVRIFVEGLASLFLERK
jgi:arginase